MPEQPIIPTTANLFKPSEIIGILRNHLATGQVNQKVVRLRGIYFKGTYINQYYHTATDRLVDKSTSDELTLSMPLNLRDDFENGNVVAIDGFDILNNLNNISQVINSQGRTETYYNSLPRYVMAHIIYRFNKKPKKD